MLEAEVAHQLALVPAAAVLVVGPRAVPSTYSTLAVALALSWIGDSLAWAVGEPFTASYIWVPLQIGLVLSILARGSVLILPLALLSVALTFPGPEILVTTVGSAAIVALARGPLRWPLYLYFGLGSLCYLLMVQGSTMYWYLYQACRAAAFMVFVALVAKERTWASS